MKNVRVSLEKSAFLTYLPPDPSQDMQPTPLLPVNNQTPEQPFLTEYYDENAPTATQRYLPHSQTHLQRPLRASLGSSSCSLPTVERALVEMEDSSTLGRRSGALTSTPPILGSPPCTTQHEASQNFFKRLSNPKDSAVSPVVSPGAGSIAVGSASPDCSGKKAPEDVEWECRVRGKWEEVRIWILMQVVGRKRTGCKVKAFASRVS